MWTHCWRWTPVLIAPAAGLGFLHPSRPQISCAPCQQPQSFSVGCYNVLCSTYAVKWKEQQGVDADGKSNWLMRWSAIKEILDQAQFDVLCLQEVEHTELDSMIADLGPVYNVHYFKHKIRPPDGVLIAVRDRVFDPDPVWREKDDNGVVFGCAELVHRASGARVCVVTGHMRGGKVEQLKAFQEFADESNADVTIITGDFNEDFRTESDAGVFGVRCPFTAADTAAGKYSTLLREHGLPQLSRPPNKQKADQKSLKD